MSKLQRDILIGVFFGILSMSYLIFGVLCNHNDGQARLEKKIDRLIEMEEAKGGF